MNNLIKNVLLVVSGAGAALGLKVFVDKRTEERKEDIYEELVIDDILTMLENADPGDERTLLIERCLHLMKTLYTSRSVKEARDTMDILHKVINSEDETYQYFPDDDDFDDIQGDEAGLADVIEELSENKDIKTTVEIVPRKENDNADRIDLKTAVQKVYEGEYEDDEEENSEDVEPEEVEPAVQPQEDVQIASTEEDECGEVGEEVDEDKFTYLAKSIITPLLERFGDDYEWKLTNMVWKLTNPNLDSEVYESYTNKLHAVVKYQKTGDKGRRKLDSIIESFNTFLEVKSDAVKSDVEETDDAE